MDSKVKVIVSILKILKDEVLGELSNIGERKFNLLSLTVLSSHKLSDDYFEIMVKHQGCLCEKCTPSTILEDKTVSCFSEATRSKMRVPDRQKITAVINKINEMHDSL